MKKYIMILAMCFSPIIVCAEIVEIDGICYELISKGTAYIANVVASEIKYKGDITIPSTVEYNANTYIVKSLADYTFNGCESLTSIVISEGVEEIGEWCFNGCKNLKSLSIPSTLQKTGGWCFTGCENIEAVYISDLRSWFEIEFGMTYGNPLFFGHHLYLNEEIVTTLVIPNDVTIIKRNAFVGCDIREILFNEKLERISELVFAGTSIKELIVPSSCRYIGAGAFNSCKDLENIYIGKTGENISINQQAFSECDKLSSVKILKGASIGNKAFENCPSLMHFYCNSDILQMKSQIDAFQDSYVEGATLHVPKDAINNYMSTEPWSDFGSIVAITEDDLSGINKVKVEKESSRVYDLTGKLIMHSITSLEGLSKGFYIINGKKVLKY